MNILFATGRMLYPFFRGGDGTTIDQLLSGLQKININCMACGRKTVKKGKYTVAEIIKMLRNNKLNFTINSNGISYQTIYKCKLLEDDNFIKLLTNTILEFKPDIIITQLEDSEKIINLAHVLKIPAILYVHDCELENIVSIQQPGLTFIFYNSYFTSNYFSNFSNIPSTVVYPVFDPEKYISNRKRFFYVTMVNPTDEKGGKIVDIVCSELKEIEFQIVLGWSRKSIRTNLPNVKIIDFGANMKEVFVNTGFVIIPSQKHESFCRLPIEAGFTKTPTVASNLDGLPESVGNGGILIDDYKNPDAWISNIYSLNKSIEQVNKLGNFAFENAKKFIVDNKIFKIESLLSNIINSY